MSLTLPLDAQGAVYAPSLDRMRLKASGIQAGVASVEGGYKVTAASGLQVSVSAGKAYVAQTGATEGTFYNGLYLVGNDGAMTPSGTPTVSSTLPTLNQIILRVFDVVELGIAGTPYAKLEWLNGTPTEGATLENRSGAAELPQSSLRLADVLVPAGAESSEHFEIRDRRSWASGANYYYIYESSSEAAASEWVYPEPLQKRVETTGNAYEVTVACEYVYWNTGQGANPCEVYFGLGVDSAGPQISSVVGGNSGNGAYAWESHVYGPIYRAWWLPAAGQSLLVKPTMRVTGGGETANKATFYKPSFALREIVGSYDFNA